MKRVLVKTLSVRNASSLKRDLLLYDEVVFDAHAFNMLSEYWIKIYEYAEQHQVVRDQFRPAYDDIDYLVAQGIIKPQAAFSRLDVQFPDPVKHGITFNFPMDWVEPAYRLDKEQGINIAGPLLGVIKDQLELVQEQASEKVHIVTADNIEELPRRIADRTKALFILSLFDRSSDIYVLDESSESHMPFFKEESICNVILRNMPIPSGKESFERIFDFRSDPTVQESRRALFRWVRSAAQTEQTLPQIVEEIEYLLGEYERLLRLHEMSYDY